MSASLARLVREAIQKQQVLRPGQRVAVAVSGGADSVALLMLLLEVRDKLGVVLSVAHVNHKLRGKSSDTDERFVADLAARHELMCFTERADVRAMAQRKKANLEATARGCRYAFFAKLIADRQIDWVAVAHTQDDQAETVLGHIFRGTGLKGLAGIHPVTEEIIRPLLGFRRETLRTYLKLRKQPWREDSSNQNSTRLRARIRKELLPLLERKFQPGIVDHLCALAELAREDSAWLDAVAAEQLDAVCELQSGSVRIGVSALVNPLDGKSSPKGAAALNTGAITKRMVRIIVQKLKLSAGQLTSRHVDAILNLGKTGVTGKFLPLPGRLQVRKIRDCLVFSVASPREPRNFEFPGQFEHTIVLEPGPGGAAVRLPHLGCVFRFTAIDWLTERRETRHTGMVLDRELLRFPLVLRNWRAGDAFRPLGHHKAHKLKDLLSEKHIDRRQRDGWPVLTSSGVLVWARGFPAAKEFAATEKTQAGIVIAEEMLP